MKLRKSQLPFILLCLAPNISLAQDAIEWKVVDRFRLFNSKDAKLQIAGDEIKSAGDNFLDNLSQDLGKDAKIETLYPEIRDFLLTPIPQENDQKPKQAFENTAWLATGTSEDGRALPNRKYRDDYFYPKNYNVRARLAAKLIAKGDECHWQILNQSEIAPFQTSCERAVLLPILPNQTHDGGAPTNVQLRQFRGKKQVFETKTTIAFNDRLIIALGDSYSSGEGNPDRAHKYGDRNFQDAVRNYFENGIDPYERWWAKNKITQNITPAAWWDGICHRSLFSQHAIASMVEAAINPHQAVTFASYSCSGAQVFGGILTPQNFPVGQLELIAPNLPNNEKFIIKPQLEAAIETLCQNQIEKTEGNIDFSPYSSRFAREESIKSAIKDGVSQNIVNCKNGIQPRKVDNILLSVGGNDAGFVAAIINALIPNNQTGARDSLVNFAKENFGIEPTYVAERKVRFLLPTLYSVLDAQLKMGIAGKETKIIQTQYPVSFLDETGKNYCDGPNANKLFAAFNSLYLDENTKSTKRWRTEITEAEGRDVREILFDPLNKAIFDNSAKTWTIVGFGKKFDNRGWCAATSDEKAKFALPALDYNNQWTPFDPTYWQPYEMRTRLFRSANDTALTQIGSNKGFPVVDTIFDHDRSIFATFGMFHPTAEAHTIMALDIAKELGK